MGSKYYSTSVDIWSVGCIFAELVNRRPLFTGQNEEDQLMKIFKGRGTPDPEAWPQLKELPLYKPDYPKFKGESLAKLVPGLDEMGLDLLEKMLKCNPTDRITAQEAMSHPYLSDVPEFIKNMR
mmetsp:Transcript_33482/g.24567  ORF Transcript_33482/g.24567 Transcript_33482/m.24567 type:complete len:124 (+) Transcript_33482:527-898(+)